MRKLQQSYMEKTHGQADDLCTEIDAGVVADTILALAESGSRRQYKRVILCVAVVAFCAGFAQQLVRRVKTVRLPLISCNSLLRTQHTNEFLSAVC